MQHVSSFTSGESGGQGVPSAVAPSPFNLHITALHPELKRARPDSFNAAEPGSAFIQAGGGGRDMSFNSRGPAAFGGGSASGMHHSSSQQQLLLHANSQAQHLAGLGAGQGAALAASAGTPRAAATPPPTPSALSMRPAMNPAAVAVLTAAITRSDGIAPSAQASLLQLLGSLVSTDLSGVVSGDAGTTVQQPQQSGSPLKTSSGISTGHQLLAAAGGPQDAAEPAAAAALAQQHHVIAKAAADCGSGSFHKVSVPIMPSVGMPGPKPLPPSLTAGSRGAPSGSAQQHESAGAGTASSTLGAGGGVAGAPSTAFAAVKQDPGGPDDDEGAAAAAACDGDAAGADGAAPPRGRTFTRISSLRAGGGSLLAPAKSLCTYKTKALAAAAGAARVGAAGSTLRLVGTICRSSSGSLVDALLSEAARAESGLLTAGLPRSDSLPDMLTMASDESAAAAAAAAAATGDINAAVAGALRPDGPPEEAAPAPEQPTAHADQPSAATAAGTAAAAAAALASLTPGTAASIWNSLKDLDLPSSLISIPSLSFLSDPNDLLSLSADDLKLLQSKLEQQSVQIMQQQQQQQPKQQQQQQPQLAPPPAAAEARPSLTPFQGHRSLPGKQLLTEDSLLPSRGGSRGMARLPSATRRAAAALFSHDAAAAAVAEHDAAVAAAAAADGGGNAPLAASGLRPPQLLDHSHLLGTASQQQQQQQALQQQYMPRADLRVSSFEIAAGLGYAALQQRQQQQQQQQLLHPGLAPHSLGQGLRQMKRQDTFDVLLRQVDQELLAEAGAKQYAALQFDTLGNAAPIGGMGAAAGGLPAIPSPYAAVAAAGGPGGSGSMYDLSGWQQPQQQQRGHGVFSTPNGFGGGVGGADSALQQQLAAAAAAASVGRGSAATDSQEVVRYSRVITCKTYLKRLNITQPMAEHLLPYHNLNVPAAKAAVGADEGDSPRGGKPASSYEMLFKDEIAVVDTSGGRFRVQYEGVSCNSQKHLRLTSGWRDYIRAHGVEVGDTIVFERRGEERRVLYASIIKGDGPGGAREARAPSATGQKRKRASRTAVQRLD